MYNYNIYNENTFSFFLGKT